MPDNAPSRIFLTTEDARVRPDLVLLNGGQTTRNREFWSGKSLRIVPDGIRTEFFDKNPLILYMHNSFIPLGQSRVFKEEGKLWGHQIKFHRKKVPIPPGWSEGLSEFDTAVIADLWDEGWIKGASVQLNYTDEDMANLVETEDEIVITTSELVEWTVCTIPAERNSLKQRFSALGVPAQFADMIPVAPDRVSELVVVRPPNIILPKEYKMETQETTTGNAEPEVTTIAIGEQEVAAFSNLALEHILGNEEMLKRFAAALHPHLPQVEVKEAKQKPFRFEFPQIKPANPTAVQDAVRQTPQQKEGKEMTAVELGRHALSLTTGVALTSK